MGYTIQFENQKTEKTVKIGATHSFTLYIKSATTTTTTENWMTQKHLKFSSSMLLLYNGIRGKIPG